MAGLESEIGGGKKAVILIVLVLELVFFTQVLSRAYCGQWFSKERVAWSPDGSARKESAFNWSSLAGLSFLALLLIAILCGYKIFPINVALCVFIPLVSITLLGFVTYDYCVSPSMHTEYSGFLRLRPQVSTADFGHGQGTKFSIMFYNAGEHMVIDSDGVSVKGYPPCQGPIKIVLCDVPEGENFMLTVDGCPPDAGDDVFDYRISIPYSSSFGGLTLNRTETGEIRSKPKV